MKIIALEKESQRVRPEDYESLLKAEAQTVWELQQAGGLREIYFRADQSQAVLILECRDVSEATALLSELPLVRHGLIEFELIPLKPYPGLARLFADHETI